MTRRVRAPGALAEQRGRGQKPGAVPKALSAIGTAPKSALKPCSPVVHVASTPGLQPGEPGPNPGRGTRAGMSGPGAVGAVPDPITTKGLGPRP